MAYPLKDAVLATIAYHDVLELPLTRFEVERYLIRPELLGVFQGGVRFTKPFGHREAPEGPWRSRGLARNDGSDLPQDIGVTLESLHHEKKVSCRNGFWCLPGREHVVTERIEKHKLAETKWKILQRWGRLLAYVPFVRLVLASGSLVFHNTQPGSDLDVLLVAKYGRIWTVRALSTGLLELFGQRRHGSKIADRICFNHFLTDQTLTMPYPSLYNAMTYVRLIPLLELGVTLKHFLAANAWLGEYLEQVPQPNLGSWKTARRPPGSMAAQTFFEWLLSGFFGRWLEARLKQIQKRRIEADPRSFEPGGRVVADDTQLEFHPASPEGVVLADYEGRLAALGLIEGEGG
ncbi:hypothetical protein HYZ80_02715 [Candidatus Parcubacteria bacterium]|nr:hypothetical protein [Candidatus Parcubacteria bacterium]